MKEEDEEVVERTDAEGFKCVRRNTPRPARAFTFTGSSGLQVPLNDPDDPLEVFEQFVDDAMIANIINQTNLRAQ